MQNKDTNNENTASSEEEELKAIIRSMEADKAKNILLLLAKDEETRDKIRIYAQKKISAKQMKAWCHEMSVLKYNFSDRNGFMDYRQASNYTQALIDFIDNKIPMLVENGLVLEAHQLAAAAFESYACEEMIDPDGCEFYFYDCLIRYWEQIISSCDLEAQTKIYEWLNKNKAKCSHEYEEEALEKIIFTKFTEASLLDKNFQLLNAEMLRIRRDDSSHRRQEEILQFITHTLEALKKDSAEIEDYLRQFYDLPYARSYIAGKAAESGE